MISGKAAGALLLCLALSFLIAEGNYLMFAPWAFISLVWIEPQSTQRSSREINRTYRIWARARPVRLGFSSAELTQMHRRKIMLHAALSLRKKKMLGTTIKMRRTERNKMDFIDTIPYLLLQCEDSRRRCQDKDSLLQNQTGIKTLKSD